MRKCIRSRPRTENRYSRKTVRGREKRDLTKSQFARLIPTLSREQNEEKKTWHSSCTMSSPESSFQKMLMHAAAGGHCRKGDMRETPLARRLTFSPFHSSLPQSEPHGAVALEARPERELQAPVSSPHAPVLLQPLELVPDGRTAGENEGFGRMSGMVRTRVFTL